MSDNKKSICPACGSSDIEATTKGYIVGPDMNDAKCHICDWEGKAHETKHMDLQKTSEWGKQAFYQGGPQEGKAIHPVAQRMYTEITGRVFNVDEDDHEYEPPHRYKDDFAVDPTEGEENNDPI